MIESDQSDKETQDRASVLNVSNDSTSNEPMQKRLREETSDDEKLQIPSKKFCTAMDKVPSEEDESTLDVNGTIEDTKEDSKNTSISDNKEDIKSTFVLKENANRDVQKLNDTKSCNKNEDECIVTDTVIEEGDKSPNKMDQECKKDSISTLPTMNIDTKEAAATNEEKDEGEEEENVVQRKKTRNKSRIEDAEVVEGLELSVECASDKESSSSSEKEDDKDDKPKPKTIIIKAQPNDSELDVSSSEAEESGMREASRAKPKQSAKRGRKRKGQTSFSKENNTDSEENDNILNKDCSPQTKRKLKKTTNQKGIKPSSKSRKPGNVEKEGRKSIEKEDKEDEDLSVMDDKKTDENSSNTESLQSRSESESDAENVSKDGERRKRKGSTPKDDKRIRVLKKYIRTAGIHVKSYNDLWAGCKSNAARVRRLKSLLEENGVNGRPTLEKCKKAKERNERLKDVAELNTGNIISEGRVTRAQRYKGSSSKETSTKHRETRKTFKRVLNVIDSDSE